MTKSKEKIKVKQFKIISNKTGGLDAVKKAIQKNEDFVASKGVEKEATSTEEIIDLMLKLKSTYKVIKELTEKKGFTHKKALELIDLANKDYQLVWSLNNPMITLDSLYQQSLDDRDNSIAAEDQKAAATATKTSLEIFKYAREVKALDTPEVELPVPVFGFHPEFFPHIQKLENEGQLEIILDRLKSNTERKQNIIYLED